jgi:serine phosphatase RsbU (regulator of sigma subunit)
MSADREIPSAPESPAEFTRQVNLALASLDTNADTEALARQIVEVATSRLGIAGARLWRIRQGEPVVWEESGKLPSPNVNAARDAIQPRRGPSTTLMVAANSHWSPALVLNGDVQALLETAGSAPLSREVRSQIALYARFSGLALASTEQRRLVLTLSNIIEATKRLNSTLDLGELINIILQIASRHTGADRGTVFLMDREHDEIWSLVGLGLAQHEIRLPTSKGLAGHVARTGETINLKDAYSDSRFEPEVDRRLGYKTSTVLCLPILNKDNETVGVIQLLNKDSGPFTSSDEDFLRALSDHCALALENAQLHRELIQKQKLERDLQLARSIQRGLLPEHPPHLEGFDIAVSHRPSQMVGGDYYDFISLSPRTLLTVIADVEGKGVASALVMANLQATLRALVQHLHSLERIVGSVNDMILADTRAQKYLSMFVGLLDQRNRTFHYINAGHVPPAVVRSSGEIVFLREGGMVVGIFPGVAYERGFIRLEPGDIFVGCTDGITEAMDVDSNEYGSTRLADVVRRERSRPAEQIVETVLADVDRYSRGGPHDDDRIIFVLKVL